MLCYATYPIRAQLSRKLLERKEKAEKSGSFDKMDYGLLPIYVISLLNFSIDHEDDGALDKGLVSRYSIRCDGNGELMTEALRFVYLELGRLTMTKDEPQKCSTLLEKFAFSLRYMHQLPDRPEGFDDDLLKKLFAAANFANMSVERQTEYEIVMRNELDIIAEKNYAREEGREEGLAQGAAKTCRDIAAKLLHEGLSIEVVQRATGLSEEEIEGLMYYCL